VNSFQELLIFQLTETLQELNRETNITDQQQIFIGDEVCNNLELVDENQVTAVHRSQNTHTCSSTSVHVEEIDCIKHTYKPSLTINPQLAIDVADFHQVLKPRPWSSFYLLSIVPNDISPLQSKYRTKLLRTETTSTFHSAPILYPSGNCPSRHLRTPCLPIPPRGSPRTSPRALPWMV
jgi:hypothetical protein